MPSTVRALVAFALVASGCAAERASSVGPDGGPAPASAAAASATVSSSRAGTARDAATASPSAAASAPPSPSLAASVPGAGDAPHSAGSSATADPSVAAATTAASTSAQTASPAASGAPSLVPAVDEAADPPLRDASGKLLPQTEERPTLDSPWFRRQLASLVDAIAKDEPERARSFFFPVEAYEAVKGIPEPAKDWKSRLFRAYGRSIHEYHKKLRNHAEGTKLVELKVPEARIQWMKPGREGNLLGYYRVTRSKLVLADGSGKRHDLDLTSMISWRGRWYVVHLHGFK